MLLDVALIVLLGASSGFFGGFLYLRHRVPKFKQWSRTETNGIHSHRFDTMLDDGIGWRCGDCGEPREEK